MLLAALLLPVSARAAAPTVRDLDPVTHTPRVLARLDGVLAGPRSGSAHEIALAYVRAHLDTLGLKDLDTLEPPTITRTRDFTEVRWRQGVDGVTSGDSELRVNVADDGRVLSVLGAPAPDLPADTTPKLDARAAIKAAGATHPSTPKLEFFTQRLAWRLSDRESSDAVYDITVDAQTGKVLRRVNLVKSDTAVKVWDTFPGAPFGGDQHAFNLPTTWLADGATNLDGPNVHVFADLNDDDQPSPDEEVRPGAYDFNPSAGSGCPTAASLPKCSWSGSGTSWTTNLKQDAVQAFYLANLYHDHLRDPPISFTDHSFDGVDKLQLQTDDGANSLSRPLNNGNMLTPIDGESPTMQLYLWTGDFRSITGGDDASLLFHEYTHGLSNRLVTDADGAGALNSPQAGAMGEAWSDWYAKDFIVKRFPGFDTAASGDVSMGDYTDNTAKIRTQGLDCPVGVTAARCPGAGSAGPGGYTYADFGHIYGSPEVHADGEIWAETLWDLRSRIGSDAAEKLVTNGLRLTPPEPSFLDARNAILQADALDHSTYHDLLWQVFAARGMGFYASTTDSADIHPVEDFSLPPTPDTPRGMLSGQITDSVTGAGVEGVTVSIGGITQGPDALAATTTADGRYTITGVPAHTYANLLVQGPGYDYAVLHDVTVTENATTTRNSTVRRDWAARAGGATATSTGDEYDNLGCGPSAAVDQLLTTTWSTQQAAPKPLVVKLPQSVDMTGFGIDPSGGCGDDSSSSTAHYTVETAPAASGPWTTVADRTDSPSSDLIQVAAAATDVQYVRLTPLSNRGGEFIDVTEFAVYGRVHATTPETTIASGPPAFGSNPTPTFTFSSNPAGATLECSLDGASYVACTSPYAVDPLADGAHTLDVRAINANGTDPTPAHWAFTIDTVAPDVRASTTSQDDTATLSFSATDATALSYVCTLDSGTPSTCTPPIHTYPDLLDGEHQLGVTATDAAGNHTTVVRSVTVAMAAPQTVLDAAPAALINHRDTRFEFSSPTPEATFECSFDSAPFAVCTSPLELTVGEGAHTFDVVAVGPGTRRDVTPAHASFTVDTTPPATAFVLAPLGVLTGRDFDLAFSASEPATFSCQIDGGAVAGCGSPLPLRGLGDGEHRVVVTATDAAGNAGAPVTSDFIVAVPGTHPAVTPTATAVAKPRALVSASVAKSASLKALRKARRLTLSVRAARGARVAVEGEFGTHVLGRVTKSSRGVAISLGLPLNPRSLRSAKAGTTLTVRIAASGSGLVAVTRTFKVKLR